MFVGVDNRGRTYLSLIQSYSNNKVMEIFLRHMVIKLDQEDAGWK